MAYFLVYWCIDIPFGHEIDFTIKTFIFQDATLPALRCPKTKRGGSPSPEDLPTQSGLCLSAQWPQLYSDQRLLSFGFRIPYPERGKIWPNPNHEALQ